MNLRNMVMGLGLLGVFGTGCVVEVSRGPYEGCKAGDFCSTGTACLPATYTSNGGAANVCSVSCSRSEQCPTSPYGSRFAPTCVVSASAGGLCYAGCLATRDCGPNTQCVQIVGGRDMNGVPVTVLACVPTSTASTSCGTMGQACCAGGLCSSGLACNPAGLCATPNRNPYQKCSTTSDVCGSSTLCLPSIAQVAGMSRGNSCTVGCPGGAASMCPGYVPGAAQQTVECANLTGNLAEAQCFRLCQTPNDCTDYNTTCTAFTVGAGTLRVCVPSGP